MRVRRGRIRGVAGKRKKKFELSSREKARSLRGLCKKGETLPSSSVAGREREIESRGRPLKKGHVASGRTIGVKSLEHFSP